MANQTGQEKGKSKIISHLNSVKIVGFVGSDPQQRLARNNGSKCTVLSVVTREHARILDGAADAEFAHAGLERGALHAQQRGGAFGAGNAPLRLLQGAQDVLALGFFQSGDRGS